MENLCEDNFLYFSIFVSIIKNESKRKIIFGQHKNFDYLFFRDCFSLFIFWKTTLSHGKLNKGS